MRALTFDFLVQLLLIVGLLGGLVYAAERYLEIPAPWKGFLLFAVIAIGLIWIARMLGVSV